jgi:HD-GYP domain-containing protein (c-di-GMP phosphodiesterase class II)
MPERDTQLTQNIMQKKSASSKRSQPMCDILFNVYVQINQILAAKTPILFESSDENPTTAYFLESEQCQKISLARGEKLTDHLNPTNTSKTLLSDKVLYINESVLPKKIKCLSTYTDRSKISFAIFPLSTEKRFLGICALISENGIEDIKTKEESIRKAISPLQILAENYLLADNIKVLSKELNSNLFSIIELLISLIEIRDHYTSGHSRNVKIISTVIAKEAGLSPAEISDLSYASVLHDVGKINVPEKILNKPYKLDDDEFEEIKKHPLTGALLVANIPKLKKIAKIILHHHERYDGQGYPMGLIGDQIPRFSRIISIADSFDAIISQRSYRKPMSQKIAIQIIREEAGKQFDPEFVNYFLKGMQDPKKKVRLVKPFHKIIL